MLNPRYLFAALEPSSYEAYKERNRLRGLTSYKSMSEMMIRNSLVKIKEAPPYTPDMEGKVLLNSLARATLDPKTGSYSFKAKLETQVPHDVANVEAVSNIFANNETVGVGVDQGVFHSFSFRVII